MIEKPAGDQGVWAVSIRDKETGGQKTDIRHIFAALGSQVMEYQWAVAFLECFGDDTAEVQSQVEDALAREDYLVLCAEVLQAMSRKITQTIEARIYGLPHGLAFGSNEVKMAEEGDFSDSQAQIYLYVADSTIFVLVTKRPEHVDALRSAFVDVRDENPTAF